MGKSVYSYIVESLKIEPQEMVKILQSGRISFQDKSLKHMRKDHVYIFESLKTIKIYFVPISSSLISYPLPGLLPSDVSKAIFL